MESKKLWRGRAEEMVKIGKFWQGFPASYTLSAWAWLTWCRVNWKSRGRTFKKCVPIRYVIDVGRSRCCKCVSVRHERVVSSPSADNEQRGRRHYNAINKREPWTVPVGPNYQFRIVINTPIQPQKQHVHLRTHNNIYYFHLPVQI